VEGQESKVEALPIMLGNLPVAAVIILLLLPPAYGQLTEQDVVAIDWPQANRIFHGDFRWKGSDAAYSIDLGQGRVLWLFGDALIAYKVPYLRREDCVAFIRNCVAIQIGYDPTVATMEFFWSRRGEKPGSFFSEEDTI
jgi:hypothetical protein